jgi:hypothetical protein
MIECFATESSLKVSDYAFPYRLKNWHPVLFPARHQTHFAVDKHSSRAAPPGDNHRLTRHHDIHDFSKLFSGLCCRVTSHIASRKVIPETA